MAQVFTQLEKIGALSQSGGVITLAPSLITIGGQQYATSSLTLTLSGLAALTRYQLYAVLSAGVVTLVKSTNENSVGPAGFTAWKLVGSFFSDGLGSPSFGAFCNINAAPKTTEIPFATTWASTGTQPAIGNGSLLANVKFDEDAVEVKLRLVAGSTTTYGTGNYNFTIPAAISKNMSADPGNTTDEEQHGPDGAVWYTDTSNLNYQMCAAMMDTATSLIPFANGSTATTSPWTASNPFAFGNTDKMALKAHYAVVNGSKTPIKDR